MKQAIIITGPTASGKSAIALKIAEKLNGEIVSADSMQIYRKMDIGTAKPDKHEMLKIKHHMIDICDIEQNYSVAQFKKDATKCINNIRMNNKMPIITGGTGLYIDSLLFNVSFDDIKVSNRSYYEEYLKDNGKEALYELLIKRDIQAALSTHVNNTKRVIRYLDILSSFSGTLEEYKKKALENISKNRYFIYVIDLPRETLYKRINDRVDIMLQNGLVKEVTDILRYGYDISCNALSAIGYKEVIEYLRGYCTYDEMVSILKQNTRNYAKRQITWFKKYKDAKLIDALKYEDAEEIASYIKSDLIKNPEYSENLA